jgi:transposase InsO family protein
MDWAIRKVLTWRLSNTLDASFCIEELEEVIVRNGKPEVMNTDQGSQYSGAAHSGASGIRRRGLDHDFDKGEHQNLNASQ